MKKPRAVDAGKGGLGRPARHNASAATGAYPAAMPEALYCAEAFSPLPGRCFRLVAHHGEAGPHTAPSRRPGAARGERRTAAATGLTLAKATGRHRTREAALPPSLAPSRPGGRRGAGTADRPATGPHRSRARSWQPASKASSSASRGSVWRAVSMSRTVMHRSYVKRLVHGAGVPALVQPLGGQTLDEACQVARHPLGLLPKHKVPGVLVDHQPRAGHGGGQRPLVLPGQ